MLIVQRYGTAEERKLLAILANHLHLKVADLLVVDGSRLHREVVAAQFLSGREVTMPHRLFAKPVSSHQLDSCRSAEVAAGKHLLSVSLFSFPLTAFAEYPAGRQNPSGRG